MSWLLGFLAKSALMQSPLGVLLYALGRGIKAFLKALNWQGWLGFIASCALAWMYLSAVMQVRHLEKEVDQLSKTIAVRNRELANLQKQLDAISSKRDEQKVVTRDNIKVVTRTIHDADGKAKEVEREPIPPTECHGVTPSGVRNADV